jgi:CBS domain-containing protein
MLAAKLFPARSGSLLSAFAADIMQPRPLSIAADATIPATIDFFARHGFAAAPVIDDAGRPVGVLSQSDILVHQHENAARVPSEAPSAHVFRACDLMTPAVFSVNPETPIPELIEKMLDKDVHHLFVLDNAGILVGVVSSLDILRGLPH